jgi:hypothetical protein
MDVGRPHGPTPGSAVTSRLIGSNLLALEFSDIPLAFRRVETAGCMP